MVSASLEAWRSLDDEFIARTVAFGNLRGAYGFGFEVGSSKKVFKAGFGWFHVEANATPALIFDGEEIEDAAPFGFPASAGSGSDRRRLQSDLSIKF